jgi:formyl-CoA transferase
VEALASAETDGLTILQKEGAMSDNEGLFSDLRVVEVATMFMAPVAGTILADFGAEVIKVESPDGDIIRRMHTNGIMPESDFDYCFMLVNRNKKGIVLDLKQPEAIAALYKLIETADVFITNFRPQALKRLKISYDDVKDLNPRLIFAYGTGYGETGPEVNQPGYDHITYLARSGVEPALFPFDGGWLGSWAPAIGDNPTAVALFSAIMAALYRREKTGKGGKVATNLLANGAFANSCLIQAQLAGATFKERRPRENAHNYTSLHYRTKGDKMIRLTLAEQERDWPKLCDALELPELVEDPRFVDLETRLDHVPELITILDERFAQHDREHWLRKLDEFDIPHSGVSTYEDVANDAQMEAIGVFADLEHPTAGTVRTITNPLDIEGEDKSIRMPPPDHGQHTVEVLEDLGYGKNDIDAMLKTGAAIQSE